MPVGPVTPDGLAGNREVRVDLETKLCTRWSQHLSGHSQGFISDTNTGQRLTARYLRGAVPQADAPASGCRSSEPWLWLRPGQCANDKAVTHEQTHFIERRFAEPLENLETLEVVCRVLRG